MREKEKNVVTGAVLQLEVIYSKFVFNISCTQTFPSQSGVNLENSSGIIAFGGLWKVLKLPIESEYNLKSFLSVQIKNPSNNNQLEVVFFFFFN